MKTLVTGGIRSGKSAYAESLLPAGAVTYIATSDARPDDASWSARIEEHRQRRPDTWQTVETVGIKAVLQSERDASAAVLIDDLGHWLTRTLDELNAWETEAASWRASYLAQRDELLTAISEFTGRGLVIVSGEVGFGLVSPYPSGRIFTDELGALNQAVAAVCDEMVLVVAGCPLPIKSVQAPRS